jgi:CRP/FNR family cyclic AMP-dependent transcriptional regulator
MPRLPNMREMLMIQKTPSTDLFPERIRKLLHQEMSHVTPLTIAKHTNVYTCGDHDERIFFIESGQIKLSILSSAGKQCLLDIYTAGDIFGELSLAAAGRRRETATAMENTILKHVPRRQFLSRLSCNSLLEEFVRYLTMRIGDQQQVIANLMTRNSEQRLAITLVQLAQKLGHQELRSIRIAQKISHTDLAEMVGTTRPRISIFMSRFRDLGLIDTTLEHHLIIKEKLLTEYAEELDSPDCPDR